MKKIIVLLVFLYSRNLFAQIEKGWVPSFMKATKGMTDITPRNENEEKILFMGIMLAYTDGGAHTRENMIKEFGEEYIFDQITKIIDLPYLQNEKIYDIIFELEKTNDARMEQRLKNLNLSDEKKRKVDKLYALVFQESLYGFSETTSFLKTFENLPNDGSKVNQAFNMYWKFFQNKYLSRDELSYIILSFFITQTYIEK